MTNSELKTLFTREEEVKAAYRDKFDRFPFALENRQSVFKPWISEYLKNQGFQVNYPKGAEFAVCLSHDIDFLYKTKRQKLSRFSRSNWNNFKRNFSALLSTKIDDEYRIEKILELERKYEFTSTYFFLALQNEEQDFNYELEKIQPIFNKILEEGSEIGLHGGHEAYKNLNQMSLEKERLEQVSGQRIRSYRNHYLRFRYPETLHLLIENKFSYDSTMGYSEVAGFRNGICYPFRPYDPVNNQFLNIIEVPLILMETTLLENMRLDIETAKKIYLQLKDEVKSVNGVLSVLWHNNNISNEAGSLYEFILEDLSKENVYVNTTENIGNFWKESDQLEQMESLLKNLIEND